jgi:hypothetical protein
MKCDDVVRAIPLYIYGEVSPAAEEAVEDHVAGCQSCAQELRLQKAVHAALDAREMAAPAGLLQECRGDLTRRLTREAESLPGAGHGWSGMSEWFRDLLQQGIPLRIPVSAMALVAVGYLAARLTGPAPLTSLGATNAALDNSGSFSSIRSIESQPSGTVRIALDEVHRREVTGRVDEEKIQRLLLAAVREDNPGVRVESVGMMKDCAKSSPVRAALLDAVTHDPIAGVRLKALEGLKAFAGDPSVRQALAQVLLHDDNPGVRIETINVLTSHHDDAMVGILQDVFQKEDNHYVRTKVQNALQEMHATVGTF